MIVEVDTNLCQGYGVCAQIAPDVFELDDDGIAVVPAGTEVPAGSEKLVIDAAAACPALAVLYTGEAS